MQCRLSKVMSKKFPRATKKWLENYINVEDKLRKKYPYCSNNIIRKLIPVERNLMRLEQEERDFFFEIKQKRQEKKTVRSSLNA